MIYCAATENGFETISGKSIEVFVPTFGEDADGNTIIKEPAQCTMGDFVMLAVAAIIAAYDFRSDEHHTVEPPVTTKEILFSASPDEITAMIQAVVELRTKWYAIPLTVPESEFEEEPGKGEQKNAQQPATDSKES